MRAQELAYLKIDIIFLGWLPQVGRFLMSSLTLDILSRHRPTLLPEEVRPKDEVARAQAYKLKACSIACLYI